MVVNMSYITKHSLLHHKFTLRRRAPSRREHKVNVPRPVMNNMCLIWYCHEVKGKDNIVYNIVGVNIPSAF